MFFSISFQDGKGFSRDAWLPKHLRNGAQITPQRDTWFANLKGGRVIYLADFRDKWTFFGLEGGR